MTSFQKAICEHLKTHHPHLQLTLNPINDGIIITPRLSRALAYAVVLDDFTRLFSYVDNTEHNSVPDRLLNHNDPQYLQKLDKHLEDPPHNYTEEIHQDNYQILTAHAHRHRRKRVRK